MKKIMKVTVGLIMSFMMLFAFTACGGGGAAGPLSAGGERHRARGAHPEKSSFLFGANRL